MIRLVFTVCLVMAGSLACGPSEEERQAAERERAEEQKRNVEELAALQAQMDLLGSTPCGTELRFTHLLVDWYVTCDGCSAIPASRIYPEVIIDYVERLAVNGSLSITDLLRFTGECE